LGLLATPMLWMRLGPADGSTDNPNSITSQAYSLASNAFGPGVTSPLEVVAHTPAGTPIRHSGAPPRQAPAATPGVLSVTPATYGRDRHYVMVDVVPTTAPDATATTDLLNRIRTTESDALDQHGISIGVGGQTAIQYDIASAIHNAFPLTVLLVIGSSFL